ncbi:hypothetical protein ABPG77_003723 [Micractinium sp. CCAP 211/92]
MSTAGRIAVALGLAGAAWAAAHLSGRAHHHPRETPAKRRRRVGRQAARHAAHSATESTEAAAATLRLQVPAVSTASAGGTAALQHAVLVLALLGSAAVLLVQQVQLNAFVQLGEKGQQLLTAAALATFVAGVAAGLSSRRRPASVVLLDTPAPAAVPVAAAAAAAAAAPPQDLTGVWAKDKELSDSMEEACDVMRLNGLVRTAIRLIKGVEVQTRADSGEFVMSVLSGILWFKITERYALDGSAREFRRRDLRRGRHVGRAQRCPTSGGVRLTVAWGEPLGGTGIDHFYLPDGQPDVLHVDTSLVVEGRPVTYRTVYRRRS